MMEAEDEKRDWERDNILENGNYTNICHVCHHNFVGHKRRVTCRLCALDKEAYMVTVGKHKYEIIKGDRFLSIGHYALYEPITPNILPWENGSAQRPKVGTLTRKEWERLVRSNILEQCSNKRFKLKHNEKKN